MERSHVALAAMLLALPFASIAHSLQAQNPPAEAPPPQTQQDGDDFTITGSRVLCSRCKCAGFP
jgi:hypothetical protein